MTNPDETVHGTITISDHPTPESYFVCQCMACRVTRAVVGTPQPVNTIVPLEMVDGIAKAAAFFCIEIAKYTATSHDLPNLIRDQTREEIRRRRGS
jgi:hypothetical protein